MKSWSLNLLQPPGLSRRVQGLLCLYHYLREGRTGDRGSTAGMGSDFPLLRSHDQLCSPPHYSNVWALRDDGECDSLPQPTHRERSFREVRVQAGRAQLNSQQRQSFFIRPSAHAATMSTPHAYSDSHPLWKVSRNYTSWLRDAVARPWAQHLGDTTFWLRLQTDQQLEVPLARRRKVPKLEMGVELHRKTSSWFVPCAAVSNNFKIEITSLTFKYHRVRTSTEMNLHRQTAIKWEPRGT